jgi:hypothetical protein
VLAIGWRPGATFAAPTVFVITWFAIKASKDEAAHAGPFGVA